MENVDDHQCRSIRMGMESTPKLLCTNEDQPRACNNEIIEFCLLQLENNFLKHLWNNLMLCRKNGLISVAACVDCSGESCNNSGAETEDDNEDRNLFEQFENFYF